MVIQRNDIGKLFAWKERPGRKPLILQGARQVGKTWLMKEFGQRYFKDTAYFSFDENPELKGIFQGTKDVERILRTLALVNRKPIVPGETLIILDEIQECNEALNSLKYFNEKAPEYAVCAAGSLLGVALARGESFPVGKVEFLDIRPLTFTEFLGAIDPDLSGFYSSDFQIEPVPEILFNRLSELFKMYLISGGMPEVASAMAGKADLEFIQLTLSNILRSYSLDFSKHVDNKDVPRISSIWNSIPAQLARENKKFAYQAVKAGARAREYEQALQWLVQAGLVYKVHRASKPGLPLSAYDDSSAFKLYMHDIGLLRRMSLLDPMAIREGNRLYTEFKGSLTENYILQSIVNQLETIPRYWTSGNQAEVDFLIQHQNLVLPVEVKSGESIRSRSLHVYQSQFTPPLAIRFSLRNLSLDHHVLNIPIFMADLLTKIIGKI